MRLFCRVHGVILVVALALSLTWHAHKTDAHPLDITYSSVTVRDDRVAVHTNLTARQVASTFLQVEENFAAAELTPFEGALQDYLKDHLVFTAQGQACALQSATLEYDREATTQLLLNGVQYRADYLCPDRPQTLQIENTLFTAGFPAQRNIMVFSDNPTAPQQVFTPQQTQGELTIASQAFHFVGSLPTDESLAASLWRFIRLGFEHVLIGYDHIAFIIGVHLVVRKIREILKIVTSFTVAHSITLTLATLGIVQLPLALVEAAIALTIVYIGIENIARTQFKGRWQITFGLGLIHGVGFSSVLRAIGIPRQFLLPDLIGFNVGVEIGQMTIVAVLMPLLLLASKWPKLNSAVIYVGSIIVSIFGVVWFLQRIT